MIVYKGSNICIRSMMINVVDEKEYKNYKFWLIEYINENGKLHRLDGPAQEYNNGDKYWYKNGLQHREDGPAVEYSNGSKFWYKNGKLHREDGPAVYWSDGNKFYYYNGEQINVSSDKEFKQYIKMKIFI